MALESQEEYVERIKTEIIATVFNIARLELNNCYIDKEGIVNKLCGYAVDDMKTYFMDEIKTKAKDVIISTIV